LREVIGLFCVKETYQTLASVVQDQRVIVRELQRELILQSSFAGSYRAILCKRDIPNACERRTRPMSDCALIFRQWLFPAISGCLCVCVCACVLRCVLQRTGFSCSVFCGALCCSGCCSALIFRQWLFSAISGCLCCRVCGGCSEC